MSTLFLSLFDQLETSFLAVTDPSNVDASTPQAIKDFGKLVLGWLKWASGACAVGCFSWIGIQMMIGRRNRSQMAAEGLAGLPWVMCGLIVVTAASAIGVEIIKSTEVEGTEEIAEKYNVINDLYGDPFTPSDCDIDGSQC